MITKDQIYTAVEAVMNKHGDTERHGPISKDSLIVDYMESLDYIEMIMLIEDEFDIIIPDPNKDIKTVEDFVQFVWMTTI